MSRSLNTRCIRRWTIELKGHCDSKHSPYWRKHYLRSYIRERALTAAHCMVERMAKDSTIIDFQGANRRRFPEFSAWYHEHCERCPKEARDFLNEDVTNDEADEEIQGELEAWND